jgi:hypothetical protein
MAGQAKGALRLAFALAALCACTAPVQNVNEDDDVVLVHPRNAPPGVPQSYVALPHGYFDPSCVARVHPGETVLDDGSIRQADGSIRSVPACGSLAYNANGQPTDAAPPPGPALNGWVENVSTMSTGALAKLSATWTVPQPPTNPGGGELDYFFNGLEGGETILQPVLTYTNGAWTATSWNCCKAGTTYHGNTINVSPGDVLVGTMTGTNCDTTTGICNNWRIETLDQNTQQSSVLDTSSWGAAETWPFAGVLEAYGVTTCADLPASGDLVFANQSYTTVSGAPARAAWQFGTYTLPLDCGYSGAVDASGTVATIGFPAAAPAGLELGSTYAFQTRVAGSSCLDVKGNATVNVTQIEEYGCNGKTSQLFTLLDAGGGLVTLYQAHSGKCVDVYYAGSANGTMIDLYDCNGTPAQAFAISSDGAGNVTFMNPHSGKCLDVTGASGADLTKIQLYDCNGSNAQKWRPLAGGLTLGGSYTLHSAASSFASCMDVSHDSSADLTQIQQYHCNGTPAQELTVVDAGGGLVGLYHPHSGKCVDVYGDASANGSLIDLFDCNASPAQQFAIQVDGAGNVTFVHPSTGKCLEVTNASPTDHTKVELYDCNGTTAQHWSPVAD